MRFDASMHVDNGAASIRLAGELDSQSAPRLQELITDAALGTVQRLVLLVRDLTYMSSAGLRCLVFAHQKLGPSVDIVMIGAQPAVTEIMELTGFDKSVIMHDAAGPS
jgi:anti-sigma B factor antagonist